MAVQIYDSSAGAFKDAQTPQIYDASTQTYKDSVGLVYDSSNSAWDERWGEERYDLITDGTWNKDLGSFYMRHVYFSGIYDESNVLVRTYGNGSIKYEMHGKTAQQNSFDVPLSSPVLPIKTLKKIFIDAGAYANVGSTIFLSFVNKNAIVNYFNSTYNGGIPSTNEPMGHFRLKTQNNTTLNMSPCTSPFSYGWEKLDDGNDYYLIRLYSGSPSGGRVQVEVDLGDGIDISDCIPYIRSKASGASGYYSYLWLYNLILYG